MHRRRFIASLGSAIALPCVAAAQQKAMPVIGFLNPTSSAPLASYLAAFRQGLSKNGYIEGQNVAIEYRWAEGNFDRLPALAADLVSRKVDVIASTGAAAPALAAKNATSTIPVVFVIGSDPVMDGLVTSLARPGGNLTGFTLLGGELTPKRLELLTELVPGARGIALLVNANDPNAERLIGKVREATHAKGLQLHALKVSTEGEIDVAFASLAELQAGGLLVAGDPFFDSRREQLVTLAARHAIPAINSEREFAAAGGLISYGTNRSAAYRDAGVYVGRILTGDKPADLPVQQSTRFELVVNVKTAESLGLTIPPSILDRADEVIE
jgi:putative ABC transport system substrate-binding protein